MNIKSKLFYIICKYMTNTRLTMSGELSVLTVDIRRSILNFDDLYIGICDAISEIKSHYKEIEVLVRKDTHQITVKFYSYKSIIHPDDYLDNLCASLSPLISKITNWDDIKCVLNIKGSITSWQAVCEFIIANNGINVDFRVISEERTSYLSNKTGVLFAFILSKIRGVLFGLT